jgi:hypothetical protein
MTMIFVSPTATLRDLMTGDISHLQLAKGLFYFGMPRNDILGTMSPSILASFQQPDFPKDRLTRGVETFCGAIQIAEGEDRVRWPRWYNGRNIEVLRNHAEAHGIKLEIHRGLRDGKMRFIFPKYPEFTNSQLAAAIHLLKLESTVTLVWV